MWKTFRLNTVVCVLLLSVATLGSAHASLELEHQTRLRDSLGGEFSAQTIGQVDGRERVTTTEARFSDFHPDDENRVINGSLSRQLTQTGKERVAVVNGSLVISGKEGGTTDTLNVQFTDLQLSHDEREHALSGQVSINGVSYAAEDMPARVSRLLRRVLRLLR